MPTRYVTRVDPSFKTVRVRSGARMWKHGRMWYPGERLKVSPIELDGLIKRGTVEEVA